MNGTKQVAQRMVNAEDSFVDSLMDLHGITKESAEKVLRVYRKLKIVKRDAVMGRMNVVHGAYLDRVAIDNAIAWEE